jgi:hypothetical protein
MNCVEEGVFMQHRTGGGVGLRNEEFIIYKRQGV